LRTFRLAGRGQSVCGEQRNRAKRDHGEDGKQHLARGPTSTVRRRVGGVGSNRFRRIRRRFRRLGGRRNAGGRLRGLVGSGGEIELEFLQDRGTRRDRVKLVRAPMLVVGSADMPEQLGVRRIQAADGFEKGARSGDLPGLREIHDALCGVDAIADEIGPRFEIGRLLDRSEMKTGAQAIRRKARRGRGLPEVLRDRERHIERVLGTRGERDQRPVAGVLDPVVDVEQGCEIPAQNRRQRGLGSVLLGRRPLRVSDQVGEEEARDERATRRVPLGFGHGEFTSGSLAPAEVAAPGNSLAEKTSGGDSARCCERGTCSDDGVPAGSGGWID